MQRATCQRAGELRRDSVAWSILEGSRPGGRYAEEEMEKTFVDPMQPTSSLGNCQHFRTRETKYCVGYSGRQNRSAVLIETRRG